MSRRLSKKMNFKKKMSKKKMSKRGGGVWSYLTGNSENKDSESPIIVPSNINPSLIGGFSEDTDGGKVKEFFKIKADHKNYIEELKESAIQLDRKIETLNENLKSKIEERRQLTDKLSIAEKKESELNRVNLSIHEAATNFLLKENNMQQYQFGDNEHTLIQANNPSLGNLQYQYPLSNTSQSNTSQSNNNQSNTSQSNNNQSNTSQSNTSQSNTSQSNTSQSNNNQSNTSQSNNEPHSNSSGNSQVVINNNKNTQLETYSGGETQQNPSGLNSETINKYVKALFQ